MGVPDVGADYRAEIKKARQYLRDLINGKNLRPDHAQISVLLAGVVAVEIAGGPTIDFIPGRKLSHMKLSELGFFKRLPLHIYYLKKKKKKKSNVLPQTIAELAIAA
ncbi:hypothetical protein L2E82_12480 [Cichorium intybus]|uniref:Uncharacterized protein n=1 Tax=Cichorium intybus TaxID=13427 RepID=A0ACB9GHB2_CICIN|nr:hypothetical protein L2E82_12480 [Cichorium intybus]